MLERGRQGLIGLARIIELKMTLLLIVFVGLGLGLSLGFVLVFASWVLGLVFASLDELGIMGLLNIESTI